MNKKKNIGDNYQSIINDKYIIIKKYILNDRWIDINHIYKINCLIWEYDDCYNKIVIKY